MGLITYIAIGIISLASLVYLYFKVAFSYWKSRNVPHLEPSFPHGNIQGLGTKIQFGAMLQNIYKQLKGTDKFCGVYFFTSPQVLVLDLDLVKSILIKDFSNFNDRSIYYNEK